MLSESPQFHQAFCALMHSRDFLNLVQLPIGDNDFQPRSNIFLGGKKRQGSLLPSVSHSQPPSHQPAIPCKYMYGTLTQCTHLYFECTDFFQVSSNSLDVMILKQIQKDCMHLYNFEKHLCIISSTFLLQMEMIMLNLRPIKGDVVDDRFKQG